MGILLGILALALIVMLMAKAMLAGVVAALGFMFMAVFTIIVFLGTVGFENGGFIIMLMLLLITCIKNRREPSKDE